jgi:hypothetical protein
LATLAQDAVAAVLHTEIGTLMRRISVAKARALDWRGFIHVPGHTRFANRLEGLGFSVVSTARIAPRDLHAEFQALGRALVTAARDARAADRLLRNEDQRMLARRLAHGRRRAYEEHHLREADRVAEQISALERLAEARRRFETEARRLEPRVRRIRTRVFDARLDSAARDDLVQELQSLQEAAEVHTATFHTAYDLAAAYSRKR